MNYELRLRGELPSGAASISAVADAAKQAATAAGHIVRSCRTTLEEGGEIDHLDLTEPIPVHADIVVIE